MNLIRIRGSEAVVLGLLDQADLVVVEHSGQLLPSGELQVAGYAPDETIAAIEAGGAVVEVIMDNAALKQRIEDLFAIDHPNGPIV
jgi:hypothetical protein